MIKQFTRLRLWMAKDVANPRSRGWRYGLVGVALGVGSPAGMFVIRFLTAHRGAFMQWGVADIRSLKWLYLYTGVGSALVFAVFGFWMGKMIDSLQLQADSLKKTSQTLRRLCVMDGLTGIYTHSYVVKRMDEEFLRAKRYGYALCCLFIDVDDFKDYNDTYGHIFGDRTLVEVSRAIAHEIRDTDILGRYGGDEFLAILPHIHADDAYGVAERIRKGVEFLRLEADQRPVVVTVSIGIFASERMPESSREILEAADQALRRAKEDGKNQAILLHNQRSATAHS